MVAVKLLRPELSADPSFQERFRRESRIAGCLLDPHVIPVHDFGEIDGVLFVEMRLLNVRSLKDLVRAQGPLEPGEASSITAQVAAALDVAYADGLVHRDVKPENVLLSRDNFAYLADFGTAGSLIGSCRYMAPERFGAGPVGPQADVYSLACVLYECLTGLPPFEGAEPQQQMKAHTLSPPPRPSIMRPGLGRAFDDVIARGMAKQPPARFSSAGEQARAATAAAASWAPAPPPVADPPSEPSGTRQFSTSYPNPDDTGSTPYAPPPPTAWTSAVRPVLGRAPVVLAAVAVAMLIAAAVMAVVLAFGNNRNPAPPGTAAPARSTASPPKTPSLSSPVAGADGLGFVGHTARCDPGNAPAAVVRTAQSLAVVCQSGPEIFYYRGERIRDGANIELADAVRASGGFDVTDPASGVRYEVRPQRLTILSNGHVDSAEPVLDYATAS
jgi:serine/threonine-protein kinase